MNPHELLRTARHLASAGSGPNAGQPSQTDLRRAVSAAYYAMFHALALSCANSLIGSSRRHRNRLAWQLVYRSLEHSPVKDRFSRSEMVEFAPGARTFAATFADLRLQRQIADYEPAPDRGTASFYRSATLELVAEAAQAIHALNSVDLRGQQDFAVYTLLPAVPPPLQRNAPAGCEPEAEPPQEDRMNFTDEQTKIVRDAVADYLAEHFRAQLTIHDIIVEPRKDHDDDDYVSVCIVYEGNLLGIDTAKAMAMRTSVRNLLREMDLPHYVVRKFAEKSEFDEAERLYAAGEYRA